MPVSKSCRNCESRNSELGFNSEPDVCMLSGLYCKAERRNPTKCGFDYRGWQQRNPGVFGRIIRMFFVVQDK